MLKSAKARHNKIRCIRNATGPIAAFCKLLKRQDRPIGSAGYGKAGKCGGEPHCVYLGIFNSACTCKPLASAQHSRHSRLSAPKLTLSVSLGPGGNIRS
jgi:hypothetical protein